MAHSCDNLIETPSLWEFLIQVKKEGRVQKIGCSLYSTEQLEKLLHLNFIPDLVQLPYSLLDRKFEEYLPKLKALGTEVHVRSVFLQGLYFKDPSSLPQKLLPLREDLLFLHQKCTSSGITMAALALNFALENKNIDHVIVGVDTIAQLKQNLALLSDSKVDGTLLEEIRKINVSNIELLNPANW